MPTLLETLDRFESITSSIRSLSQSQPTKEPGPFTAALLDASPQQLLRDADEAEYGLFSLVRGPSDLRPDGPLTDQLQVKRREFKGATPLRGKPAASRRIDDEEPEVYVEAGLKYLDLFQAVKQMPHLWTRFESYVERLNIARDNIERLQEALDENAQNVRASPKSQVEEEERRISELKSRILQLRQRKEAFASKLPATSKKQTQRANLPYATKGTTKTVTPRTSFDSPSSIASTSIPSVKAVAKTNLPRSNRGRTQSAGPRAVKSVAPQAPVRRIPSNEPDEAADGSFWSRGKAANLRLSHVDKSDYLLNEKLDMSGFDMLASPTPNAGPSRQVKSMDSPIAQKDVGSDNDAGLADGPSDVEEEGSSDSGEPTIVLSKKAPPPQVEHRREKGPLSPPPSRPPSQVARSEPRTPLQDDKTGTLPPSTKTKVKRTRITTEIERICAKIWSTIPDLLVPGNNFHAPGKKPPNAKDTFAVLQTISAQPISGPTPESPSSPSTHSTLSSLLGIETLGPAGGSPHQIMTSHLLLSLLTAPNHVMPMQALKALLAAKATVPSPGPEASREVKQKAAALAASAAQIATRALYGCVAKKLVKIDRGGGEQVVKFDSAT